MKLAVVSAIAAISVISAYTAFGEEVAEPKATDVSVTLGGTLNDGNTESTDFNAAIDVEGAISTVGTFKAGAAANFAKSTTKSTSTDADGNSVTEKNTETTAENYEAKGRVDFNVSDPISAYFDASYLRDEIADIDYRITAGPGLSYNFLKDDVNEVRLDAGISPMWERTSGDSEFYTMGRAAEYASHAFANGAKVWESVEFLQAFEDGDKYLVNAEVGVESPLSDRLSLRLVAQDKYNSLPADGNEKNDVKVIAAVRIKL